MGSPFRDDQGHRIDRLERENAALRAELEAARRAGLPLIGFGRVAAVGVMAAGIVAAILCSMLRAHG
jgi:hypothetical protein